MTKRCPDGMFPNGHFYSPVIDPAEVEADSARIWPVQPDVRGVDFGREAQREVFPRYIHDYDYPEALGTRSASSTATRRSPGSTAARCSYC